MTSKNLYHHATFLLSAPALEYLPPDTGEEVAFIGRSNSGKSSSINAITGINGLARSSKTPGRTQTINYFRLDNHRRLVDLPGYGYAKVPLTIKLRWQQFVHQYLETRTSLTGLILTMDIRHPMKDSDLQIINWIGLCEIPLHILLTKCDKLSHGAASSVLRQVEQDLQSRAGTISVQLFSSLDGTGLDKAWTTLNQWLPS